MEIKLNDVTLAEAQEELAYRQRQGYSAFFKGRGNGEVVLIVEDK